MERPPLSAIKDPTERDALRADIILATHETAKGYNPKSVHEIDGQINAGTGNYDPWNAVGAEYAARTGTVVPRLGKIASNLAEQPKS